MLTAPGNEETFDNDVATVEFSAVDGAIYRLRIRDIDGILLTSKASTDSGATLGANDAVGTLVTIGAGDNGNRVPSLILKRLLVQAQLQIRPA